MNDCGTCTWCCKVTQVPEIHKAPYVWCKNCSIGKGCDIYDQRPESCRKFTCVWLSKQLPPDLRPDKCKVMFEEITPTIYLGLCDPGRPNAWKERKLQSKVADFLEAGKSIVCFSGPRSTKNIIVPDGEKPERIWAEVVETAKLTGVI